MRCAIGRAGVLRWLFPWLFAGAVLLPGLRAGPASATPCPAGALCFDQLASGSAVSAADLGGVSVRDALVLSEADASLALGVPLAGVLATSGDRGLLNALQPSIRFDLPQAASRFQVDVVGLLDAAGSAVSVVAEAFADGVLVARLATDPARVGDSGLPEQSLELSVGQGFDQVLLRPDLSTPLSTTFWIDTVRIQALPAPGAACLLGGAALVLAARVRRRHAGPPAPGAVR
mgnify:CR=1 FL=1